MKFVLDHHWKREDWRDVVFTDEKKWNLDGPSGLKFYWAGLEDEPAICLNRVCGGQSLMVWGAINGDGKLALLFTKDYYSGGQTAAKYLEMLDKPRVIYSNVRELREAVEDVWEQRDDCYARDLYDSMSKRIIQVALVQGKTGRF
ncbi:Transposable element Tc3 transposase [Porphyridium purpureum]|uniref:Transposable element Tc3 transposase n=1 Tax=Porphyridium purpureum TaxID=35688 RepID=A0A5J4YRD6_PORPP|nr:Transposable element Tc3 transposase [Porphyridium purpureum]|eukprot:POR7122..scf236_6